MNTNSVKGRSIAASIGAYMIIKAIINMILGGGLMLSDLMIAAGMTCALLTGMQFLNYVVAAVLVIIAVKHLPANISNIGSNWIYLAEGIADIVCAAILVIQSDVREHFTTIKLKK